MRTIFSAPTVDYERDGKPATFWGLQGAASLRDKNLTLTVVNPHVSEARDTEVVLRGAKIKSASALVLTNSDLHAHNTFAEKNTVVPKEQSGEVRGDVVNFRFAPASVTKLSLQLG